MARWSFWEHIINASFWAFGYSSFIENNSALAAVPPWAKLFGASVLYSWGSEVIYGLAMPNIPGPNFAYLPAQSTTYSPHYKRVG
jgi:hypothetical protein